MGQEVAKTKTIYLERPSWPAREVIDLLSYCRSGSHREADGSVYLLNMPTPADREVLRGRVVALLAALKKHDQKEVGALVADMLASYDVAQVKQLTGVERKAQVVLYVRELAGVPTWAVAEACNRIRLGTAPDISHQYKPTPIQVRVLAISFAQPFKDEVGEILMILGGKQLEKEISEEERERIGGLLRQLAEELRLDWTEAEANRRRQWLDQNTPRIAAARDAAILADYARHGEEPLRTAHGALVSRSLAQMIAQQNAEWQRKQAAAAEAEASAEKGEPDIPF
jgi:hypothetical protein